MLGMIEKKLLSNWSAYGIPGPAPRRLDFILSSKHVRIRFFAFADGARQPCLFIKTVRFPLDAHVLQNEIDRTAMAEQQLAGASGLRVPRLLDSIIISGRPYAVYEYVEGRSFERQEWKFLLEHFEYWYRKGLFAAITLGKTTGKPVAVAEMRDVLLSQVQEFECAGPEWFKRKHPAGEIGHHIGVEDLAASVEKTVLVHGDFGLNNFMWTSEGETVLLDWEFSPGYGLPFEDLLYYILHYGICYARNELLAAKGGTLPDSMIQQMFVRSDMYDRVILPGLIEYSRSLGVSLHLLPRVLLLVLVRLVNHCRTGGFGEFEKDGYLKALDCALNNYPLLLPAGAGLSHNL